MTRITIPLSVAIALLLTAHGFAQTTFYVETQDAKTGKWTTYTQRDTSLDSIKFKGSKNAYTLAEEAAARLRRSRARTGEGPVRIRTKPTDPKNLTPLEKMAIWKEKYRVKTAERRREMDKAFDRLKFKSSYEERNRLQQKEEQLKKERIDLQNERDEISTQVEGLVEKQDKRNQTQKPDLLGGKPPETTEENNSETNGDMQPAVEPDNSDMIEQLDIENRLKKFKLRSEKYNKDVRDYETASKALYRNEAKLGFAKSYKVPVVRVGDRKRTGEQRVSEILDESARQQRSIVERARSTKTRLKFGVIYIAFLGYDGHRAFMFDKSGTFIRGSGGQTTSQQGRAIDLQVALSEIRQKKSYLANPNYGRRWKLRNDGMIQLVEFGHKLDLVKLSGEGTSFQLYSDFDGEVSLSNAAVFKVR